MGLSPKHPFKCARGRAWRLCVPREPFPRRSGASGLRDREHRLAADRLGGQAGQFHVQLGLRDEVELRSQPRLIPQHELAFEAILLPVEDRRAGGAYYLCDCRPRGQSGGKHMQAMQVT